MKEGREEPDRATSRRPASRLAVGIATLFAAAGCGESSLGPPGAKTELPYERDEATPARSLSRAQHGRNNSPGRMTRSPDASTRAAPDPAARPERLRSTSLTLVCVDEQGRPVRPAKADLLLVAWGATERVPLPVDGNTVRLRLDAAWIHEAWPFSRVQPNHGAHVLLEAPGHVTLRSETVLWLGVPEGKDRWREQSEVRFPWQRGAWLSEGMNDVLQVVFRRPKSRHLKIVDLEGRPVLGVEVKSYIFWSNTNHCCMPIAAESLGVGTTDAEGKVDVIDGDFLYGFEVQKKHWSLTAVESCYPDHIKIMLAAEETVLHMREHRPQRLEILITEDGVPAARCRLWGELAPWRCGAIDGIFAVADENGRIVNEEFYPDEWTRLWVEKARRNRIWSADPRQWTYPARLVVKITDGAASSQETRMDARK